RSSAFEKVAINDGFVESDQLHFAGDEADRINCFVAVREIAPDGTDLAADCAVEDIREGRLAVGERRGHARPGTVRERAEQIMMEPGAGKVSGDCREADGINAAGSLAGKSMALDARESLRANEAAAASFYAFFVVWGDVRCRRRPSQRGIRCFERANKAAD